MQLFETTDDTLEKLIFTQFNNLVRWNVFNVITHGDLQLNSKNGVNKAIVTAAAASMENH